MKAKCYYCNKELTERTIKRHVKNCSTKNELITDEFNSNKKSKNQFIISMKDKYDKNIYCLYISIDENLQLQHLDTFIRDVWVECCEHLSSFYINEMRYDDNSNELYQMNVKLKDVLHVNEKFQYEYDFGSTTHIILEVVDKIKVSKNHSQIEILARNEEPYKSLDNDDEYFNSPRDGVCCYYGNRNAELQYMPGNNNIFSISKEKPILEDDYDDYDDPYDLDIRSINNSLKNILDTLVENAFDSDKQISEADLEANLMSIFQEHLFNKQMNIIEESFNEYVNYCTDIFNKGIFSFDLEELLNKYTKSQLNELSKIIGIKISSNSKKSVYIETLISAYPTYVRDEIYKLNEAQYNILKKCLKNKGLFSNIKEDFDECMVFRKRNLLFATTFNGEPVFIMPTLVQDIFNNINAIDINIKLKSNTEIINLFRGMIKAYGILSYDNTIMLLKRYISNFDETNVIEMIIANEDFYYSEYKIIDDDHCFENYNNNLNLFVNSSIYYNFNNILDKFDANLEYSYISKEKLLAMAKSNYLEKSNFAKKLIKTLSTIFVIDKENISNFLELLANDIQTRNIDEIIPDAIYGLTDGIELMVVDRLELEKNISNFLMNIPIWRLKGNFLNKPTTSNEQIRSLKIGRNEPCPCGSGKKYKNCCGKVIKLF